VLSGHFFLAFFFSVFSFEKQLFGADGLKGIDKKQQLFIH
jgi:hypothetical protein